MTSLKVLAVADGMIPSVELVLERPLRHLQECGLLKYRLAVISETGLSDDLDGVDLLILMRCCQPEALALAEAAEARGIPFIYAIDDDFEALDPETPLGAYYASIGAWGRILRMCGKASQVWAFSEALRAKISVAQSRIVVPPAIASLEIIDGLRQAMSTPVSGKQGKVIGYAATTYHAADLLPLVPTLFRLLEDRPDLRIEFVGVRCEPLIDHPRVTHFDHLPGIEAYYAFVLARKWDASIAPLKRSAFNDAKTDNKYREYAALGVPAVYADAPSYWGSVIHNHNGLVAVEPDEWYEGLKRLLTDDSFAESVANHARADAMRRYSVANVSAQYFQYMRSAVHAPRRVLVLGPDIPTTDIDVVRPFNRLADEGALEWRWVKSGVADGDLKWAELLVIVRDAESPTLWALRKAREELGIPVVFTWDDDFLVFPDSLGAISDYYRSPAIVAGLHEVLSTADLVKASTARLAERSSAFTNRILQAPYGFDFAQVRGVSQRREPSDEVVIGFFGSVSHVGALGMIVGALDRVREAAPNVRFEFFGPRSKELEELGNVTFIPYSSSSTESLRTLAERSWDIGLAPLQDSEFNRAKLPTKYRDYGACHIAGVYSRLDPFESVVTDHVTGMLVGYDQDAWFEAIMALVNDPELRRSVAAAAHAHVRSDLSLECAVDAWRGVFESLVPRVDVELDSNTARKLAALEQRADRLGAHLDVARRAGQLLLEERSKPLGRSLVDRVIRRFFRLKTSLQANPPILTPPDVTAFAIRLDGSELMRRPLALSVNLQHLPYLEYRVPSGSLAGGAIRVAVASAFPGLGGMFGVEMVSPDGVVAFHAVQPISQIGVDMIAQFRTGDVAMAGDGWLFRVFVRDCVSPFFVYERGAVGQRTLLFEVVDATAV
jgi:glycosyltransferase involved in cell wall biosynthesis